MTAPTQDHTGAPDTFRTLESISEGRYRERGSVFHAVAFPAAGDEAVRDALLDARRRHPKARHHCHAACFDGDPPLVRTGDAREPKGSAGLPILHALQKHRLVNAAVVVSRYFGGKQLGLPALTAAYHHAALDALTAGRIVVKHRLRRFDIDIPFALRNDLFVLLRRIHAGKFTGEDLGDGKYRIALRAGRAGAFLEALAGHPSLHACTAHEVTR